MEREIIPSSLAAAIGEIMNELGVASVKIDTEAPESGEGHDLIVVSGLIGDVKGILLIEFTHRDAVCIANMMLRNIGQEHESGSVTREHKEALAEIGNLLTGRFVNILSEKGIDVNLTPPSIITGSDVRGSTKALKRAVAVRVSDGSWSFDLSLMISQ
jgi:chemotaxis protein CheX